MTAPREQATVFGEVAGVYDDVRPGYPDSLVDAVLSAVGAADPATVRAVEPGAGTGKATAAFAAQGLSVTCVEPDPQMAAVLRARFADELRVTVRVGRFEQWVPPVGGVDLLYCAQAWHWLDEPTRCRRGYDALRPGGVVALFGHAYMFADEDVLVAVEDVYRRLAPSLIHDPVLTEAAPLGSWFAVELAASGLFTDLSAERFHSLVRFPTDRYLSLLATFSPHRMLPDELRAAVFAAVAETVDGFGGYVDVDLATVLAVARRPV